MANQGSRIPRDITGFIPYIHSTDDRQLEVDPATTNPRWQAYGWTNGESDDWTDFRDEADRLFALYDTKGMRRPNDTNDLHLLIQSVVDYEREHHLFDKIVIAAAPPVLTADYTTFNIIRGTPLEDKTPTVGDVEMGEPNIVIKEVTHLVHFLEVTNPNKGTRPITSHINNTEVWRAVIKGGDPEPEHAAYTYIGDVKRETFKSVFTDDQKRMDAWYKSRFKSTTGKFGEFSRAISETVI